MTTFTAISNPAVGVGGIPSSATVTALRDNPIAIAEGSTGGPVMVSGWHPVDKVTIGDGKTGLIYDFGVTGAVASVVTPDFEDGYEYRIHGNDVGSSGSSGNLQIEPFLQDSAAYDAGYVASVTAGGQAFQFDVTMLMPRLPAFVHFGTAIAFRNATELTSNGFRSVDTAAAKILRARVRFTVGNINFGKIYLFRRREYATLP